jgi:hypothetical protein
VELLLHQVLPELTPAHGNPVVLTELRKADWLRAFIP